MQSLQVQPEILSQGQVLVQNALVSEEELPAAEALVQLPFQTLPPPQTVAVNLQVQPPAPVDPPVVSPWKLFDFLAELKVNSFLPRCVLSLDLNAYEFKKLEISICQCLTYVLYGPKKMPFVVVWLHA